VLPVLLVDLASVAAVAGGLEEVEAALVAGAGAGTRAGTGSVAGGGGAGAATLGLDDAVQALLLRRVDDVGIPVAGGAWGFVWIMFVVVVAVIIILVTRSPLALEELVHDALGPVVRRGLLWSARPVCCRIRGHERALTSVRVRRIEQDLRRRRP
jgi:hypothetical protein